MKIGLAQLNSRQNKSANLAGAAQAVEGLVRQGVDLILLPEMFNFHGLDEDNAVAAESIPGPASEWASGQARTHGVFLHCGSLIERRGEELRNTSLVFDRAGSEIARYSKIHLFDARTPDGLVYAESDTLTAGSEVTVTDCEGVTVGLAICYDLRFPQLFHALVDRGAQLFLVPAAFTIPTGISHWEPLVRARAIENGCFVAACGQWGPYARGRANYGHSVVVDPWGMVIAQCHEGPDTISVDLDMGYLRSVRERMPVQRHRRHDLFR